MNEKVKALLDRLTTFDGNFDGYPTTSCYDELLVSEAAAECLILDANPVGWLAFLISEQVTEIDQLEKARAFYNAYVETIWVANMIEGNNPAFDELTERDDVKQSGEQQ